MTNKEAIADLETLLAYIPIYRRFYQSISMGIKALKQEPCEDEYIKVPKKALKYRTAGMVAYNAEWLKNHFDIERAVICGTQEPKTGHWIIYDVHGHKACKCSECDKDAGYPCNDKYCRHCGTRMVEPQESEDEE